MKYKIKNEKIILEKKKCYKEMQEEINSLETIEEQQLYLENKLQTKLELKY